MPRQNIETDISALVPDNNSGQVTPLKQRQALSKALDYTDEKFGTGNPIAFSANVPFDKSLTIMQTHTMAENITLSKVTTGAIPGARTVLRIVAGTGTLDFTTFKQTTGSSGFVATAGILNVLQLFFDGTDYWVSIFQEANAVPLDTTAPTLVSARVENATRNKIDLKFSETVSTTVPAGTTVTATGSVTGTQTAMGLARTFTDTIQVTFANDWVAGEAISFSYVQGGTASDIADLSGNKFASVSNGAVTNNIVGAVLQFVPSNWTAQNGGFKGNSSSAAEDTAFSAQALTPGKAFILRDAPTNTSGMGQLFGVGDNPRAGGTTGDIDYQFQLQQPSLGFAMLLNGGYVGDYTRGDYFKIANESGIIKIYKSADGINWGGALGTLVSNPGTPQYVVINLNTLSAVESLQFIP